MGEDNRNVEEKLAALKRNFHAKLAVNLEGMAASLALAGAPGDEPARKSALRELEMQAHKMCGTAGTFGMDDLTDPARALEEACRQLNEAGRLPAPEEHASMARVFAQLREAYAKVPPP